MGDNPVVIGQNNLGGVGPNTGDEVLEFLKVGIFGEEQIDMVVTIVGGNYVVHNAEQNRVRDYFGQINIKADHQADMQFCFVSHSSKTPIILDTFSLTFHDFGASSIRAMPAFSRFPAPLLPPPFDSSH